MLLRRLLGPASPPPPLDDPRLRLALDKRRLERICRDAGVTGRLARQIVATYFDGQPDDRRQ